MAKIAESSRRSGKICLFLKKIARKANFFPSSAYALNRSKFYLLGYFDRFF